MKFSIFDDLGFNETELRDMPVAVIGKETLYPESYPIQTHSPINGSTSIRTGIAGNEMIDLAVRHLQESFLHWRRVPAPKRGELVRKIAETVRTHKKALGEIITWEVGKTSQEAEGEIQEWIDLCDFAMGLSRQLYGLTIASERPEHRLMEQWHPLGPVGVITAFNFPVAVWSWNAMIALVCGDTILWKPSEQTPLTSLACHLIVAQAITSMEDCPGNLMALVTGDHNTGRAVASHPGLPLVSATGSIPMGRNIASTVAKRLGQSLLELSGNNGMIVAPSADLDMAIRAIVFASAGTCGQRCTTLRRLIVHRSIYPGLVERLKKVYSKLPVGDPRDKGILVGPLVNRQAWEKMEAAIVAAKQQGGSVYGGNRIKKGVPNGGYYVQPAIVEVDSTAPITHEETFAPILYVMKYDDFEDAVAINNQVAQGLSSAVFTSNNREAELFLSVTGSDCGLANVNIGTSGAEIGGAFGGEKETGGGRESGSDAWKNYMRRQTATINYSNSLPLAQGIRFDF